MPKKLKSNQVHKSGDKSVDKSKPKQKVKKYKTYGERAEYLTFITPSKKDIYHAIAEFFGPDEIPPIPKNYQI